MTLELLVTVQYQKYIQNFDFSDIFFTKTQKLGQTSFEI